MIPFISLPSCHEYCMLLAGDKSLLCDINTHLTLQVAWDCRIRTGRDIQYVKGHPGRNNTDQTVGCKIIHTQYNNAFRIWGERGLSSAFWNNIRIPVRFVCVCVCVCVWKTLAGMPEFHSVHQECWLKRITEEDRGIKQGTF